MFLKKVFKNPHARVWIWGGIIVILLAVAIGMFTWALNNNKFASSAATGDPATINGRVFFQGNPQSGATVILYDTTTNTLVTNPPATSGADGLFSLPTVIGQQYMITSTFNCAHALYQFTATGGGNLVSLQLEGTAYPIFVSVKDAANNAPLSGTYKWKAGVYGPYGDNYNHGYIAFYSPKSGVQPSTPIDMTITAEGYMAKSLQVNPSGCSINYQEVKLSKNQQTNNFGYVQLTDILMVSPTAQQAAKLGISPTFISAIAVPVSGAPFPIPPADVANLQAKLPVKSPVGTGSLQVTACATVSGQQYCLTGITNPNPITVTSANTISNPSKFTISF